MSAFFAFDRKKDGASDYLSGKHYVEIDIKDYGKIQLELAPPTPVGEGQELKNENLSKPKAEATSVYRGLRV